MFDLEVEDDDGKKAHNAKKSQHIKKPVMEEWPHKEKFTEKSLEAMIANKDKIKDKFATKQALEDKYDISVEYNKKIDEVLASI